jgi:invasion protein IalB
MHIRIPLLLCLAATLTVPAAAQTKKPEPTHPPAAASNAPKQIAQFDDWTAATHEEGGQTVCYALTRAQSSSPSLPGRGDVVLTVTERTTARDTVAIEAGFDYAKDTAVTVQIDQTGLDFYTRERDAYARDGKAAVAAFQKGERAIARSPGPKGQQVTDTFSLKGFSAAYAAIVKACPAPKG